MSSMEREKHHSINKYFPKPKPLGKNVKVDLDLSSYATKAYLKKGTSLDTSEFA